MNSYAEFISNRVVTGSRHRSLVTWRQSDLVSDSDSCPVITAVSTDKHPCASNGRASSEGLQAHLFYYTLKDVKNEWSYKKKRARKRILKSKKSTETETKNKIQTQMGKKLQSKKYWRLPFDQTVQNGWHIQGDQKVSVHLMITIQKAGAQRLFDNPIVYWKKKYASFLVMITLHGDTRFYIQKN